MDAGQQAIPTPALVLGLGGLIPFFTTAILVWLPTHNGYSDIATLALGGYGAVILSFLGGVRWGNLLFDHERMQQWMPLTLSVLPSLIAWPALMLPPVWMLALLAAGFVLQYALDVAAGKREELPTWFLRLRLILTCGAVFSLLVGLSGNMLFPGF